MPPYVPADAWDVVWNKLIADHVARDSCRGYGTMALTLMVPMISKGTMDINFRDDSDPMGWTPLMLAAFEGNTHVVGMFLEKGASVSIFSKDSGHSPLHLSARQGHVVVTEMLTNAGADLEARSADGYTPLHLAAEQGHWEVIVALIEAGAKIDPRMGGETPLYKAA